MNLTNNKKDIITNYLKSALELANKSGYSTTAFNKLKLFLEAIGTDKKRIKDMEEDILAD